MGNQASSQCVGVGERIQQEIDQFVAAVNNIETSKRFEVADNLPKYVSGTVNFVLIVTDGPFTWLSWEMLGFSVYVLSARNLSYKIWEGGILRDFDGFRFAAIAIDAISANHISYFLNKSKVFLDRDDFIDRLILLHSECPGEARAFIVSNLQSPNAIDLATPPVPKVLNPTAEKPTVKANSSLAAFRMFKRTRGLSSFSSWDGLQSDLSENFGESAGNVPSHLVPGQERTSNANQVMDIGRGMLTREQMENFQLSSPRSVNRGSRGRRGLRKAESEVGEREVKGRTPKRRNVGLSKTPSVGRSSMSSSGKLSRKSTPETASNKKVQSSGKKLSRNASPEMSSSGKLSRKSTPETVSHRKLQSSTKKLSRNNSPSMSSSGKLSRKSTPETGSHRKVQSSTKKLSRNPSPEMSSSGKLSRKSTPEAISHRRVQSSTKKLSRNASPGMSSSGKLSRKSTPETVSHRKLQSSTKKLSRNHSPAMSSSGKLSRKSTPEVASYRKSQSSTKKLSRDASPEMSSSGKLSRKSTPEVSSNRKSQSSTKKLSRNHSPAMSSSGKLSRKSTPETVSQRKVKSSTKNRKQTPETPTLSNDRMRKRTPDNSSASKSQLPANRRTPELSPSPNQNASFDWHYTTQRERFNTPEMQQRRSPTPDKTQKQRSRETSPWHRSLHEMASSPDLDKTRRSPDRSANSVYGDWKPRIIFLPKEHDPNERRPSPQPQKERPVRSVSRKVPRTEQKRRPAKRKGPFIPALPLRKLNLSSEISESS